MNHVRLLLLDENHAAFHRVLDAEPGDDAWPSLTDTMTSISRLPLGSGVPPTSYGGRTLVTLQFAQRTEHGAGKE